MERLTKYCEETSHKNGICCTHFGGPECCEVGGNCALNCKWEEAAWERLARYEDARLTPAEVHSMYGEWNAMMSVLNSIGGYDRLRELAEADRDGTVLILPCKVGDTVYRVFAPDNREPVIRETQVKTLGQAADLVGRIGKLNKLVSVFGTYEEAEQALREMRDESTEIHQREDAPDCTPCKNGKRS